MNARTRGPCPPILCALFDDLDLENPEDESEWDRRVMRSPRRALRPSACGSNGSPSLADDR